MGHKIYRKPTHTNRYLHAQSNHAPSQKNSLISTLIVRANRVCDKNSIKNEITTLRSTLLKNGYTIKHINKILNKVNNKYNNSRNTINNNNITRKRCCLPYIEGITNKIKLILKQHNIETAYTTTNTIHNFINTVKDKIPYESEGIYKINCSCGLCYIGQTKRNISTRLKEHIRYTKLNQTDKSALAEHSHNTKHLIDFDTTKILNKEKNYYKRIIRESIEIYKHKNQCLNREDGFILDKNWKVLF